MAKIILYAVSLLIFVSQAVSPLECAGLTSMFGTTKEELIKRLADNNLTPDAVFKLIKKGSHAKDSGELKINGLGVQDLIELNYAKIGDCDEEIVLERIGHCERAAQTRDNQFASIVNYCKDRVAKLIGFCTQNIESIITDSLLEVPVHDLDIMRRTMARHIHDAEPDFKSTIDEHMAPHQYDRPTERKHTDLGNSCEHFTRAFEPIKVIVDHEKEFGIVPTENEHVLGWMKVYKMCEFYFDNYKDCEGC